MILFDVLIPTGRKQGRIMIEYSCRVSVVIGKTVQPEGDWVLKISRLRVGKEEGIVQALEEDAEPFGCLFGDQLATWEAVQGLAVAGASDLLALCIWKGAGSQRWKVGDVVLEIQLSPQLNEPPGTSCLHCSLGG